MVKEENICDTSDSACCKILNVANKQIEQTKAPRIHLLIRKPALILWGLLGKVLGMQVGDPQFGSQEPMKSPAW